MQNDLSKESSDEQVLNDTMMKDSKPIAEEDNSNLVDLYKKLIEYKNNLFKIDTLLSLDQDEATKEELSTLRNDLVQAISYQEDVIKFNQNSDDFIFSVELLTDDLVGRICKAYLKPEGKWFNSRIEAVDVDTQEAEVAFFSFPDKVKLESIFIKVLPIPNPANFEAGTYCEAIYSGDGKFYPCVIEKVSEAGYHLKFKRYNNKEIVPLTHLRETRRTEASANALVENMTELKIPDHLKILPNDSEAERMRKKKKVKALKKAWKIGQIEKDSNEKQSKWSDFTDKAAKQKKGYFSFAKNKESIFRSPDTVEGKVGVTGSGKGMTNFSNKQKTNAADASHLSKLF